MGEVKLGVGFRAGRTFSNEAALSLRSRRNGTKFAEPLQVRSLSANVFQGASFGIGFSCADLLAVLGKENLLFYCL